MNIKKVAISPAQIERGKKLFPFKGLKNSITKGLGNMIGAVGEIVVCDTYGGVQQNTYDYDLLINGYKIDVKTKNLSRKATPQDGWNAQVSDFNTTQKCDFYCFVFVTDDFKTAFIGGFIAKDRFYEKATFNKKGEVNGYLGWVYKSNCYNIPLRELRYPKK